MQDNDMQVKISANISGTRPAVTTTLVAHVVPGRIGQRAFGCQMSR